MLDNPVALREAILWLFDWLMYGSRMIPLALLATLVFGVPSLDGRELDPGKITCGEFLASGRANMAATIMWLRGYHAGKSGLIPFQSPDPYGGRLGYYCRQHPDANLLEASEKILADLDRGI